ncbi:HK97 gp10 family phage protein [Aeromonas veronii]|uniref:HK97 gp10 family phage protein n=1 Tax=Aeromonas veronii TaxID=654 RepID=UPI003D1C01B1
MAFQAMTFSITGGQEVIDGCLKMGTVLSTKAMRKAMRQVLQPILQDIIQSAPINNVVLDGVHLKDAFKIKIVARNNSMRKSDTFLRGYIYTKGEVNAYATMVEFGRNGYTAERNSLFGKRTRPYNVDIAPVQANPFMRTAFYRHAPHAAQQFIDATQAELERLWNSRTKTANSYINKMAKRSAKLKP